MLNDADDVTHERLLEFGFTKVAGAMDRDLEYRDIGTWPGCYNNEGRRQWYVGDCQVSHQMRPRTMGDVKLLFQLLRYEVPTHAN